MTTEEVNNLANAIKNASSKEEFDVILKSYDSVQSEANLYPVNEIESQRLWKMAMLMWMRGRAYERLYVYENNLK